MTGGKDPFPVVLGTTPSYDLLYLYLSSLKRGKDPFPVMFANTQPVVLVTWISWPERELKGRCVLFFREKNGIFIQNLFFEIL